MWICCYSNGDYAGFDANSGGYPYSTTQFVNAYIWTNLEMCKDYVKHFPKLEIFELKVELKKV